MLGFALHAAATPLSLIVFLRHVLGIILHASLPPLPLEEALELLLDPSTPSPVRLTMLAALSYLLMPADLIPDILPVAGFSDDLVALTAVIGAWRNHLTPAIQARAQRRLDQWFPLTR